MTKFYKQLIFVILALAVIVAGGIAIYAVNNRGAGPVAWYKMDEGYASTTYDASGNSNNGTLTGPVWQDESQCKSGKCLFFDGVDDYVNVGNGSSLNFGSTMTISLWFRGNINKTVGELAGRRTVTGCWQIHTSAGKLAFSVWQSDGTVKSTDTSGVSPLSNNVWYHIVGVADGSYVRLYVNGQSWGVPTAYNGTIKQSVSEITYIAQADGDPNRYSEGQIDDARIYNYARSASQIKADYTKSAGGKGATVKVASLQEQQNASDGLVAYWKMDESSWASGTAAVIDSSGNGNTGTVYNGANTTSTAKFGMAGNFDGTDDYVDAGKGSSLYLGTGDFTQSFWVKRAAAGTYFNIFSKSWIGTGEWQMRVFLYTDNQIYVYLGSYAPSRYHIVGGSVADTLWHHIVVVRDITAGQLYVYKDGVRQTMTISLNDAGVGVDLSQNSSIMSNVIGGNGLIDDVKIYNKARTPEQIRRDYETGPPPVAHWKMDENQGQYAFDISGNQNVGTLGSGATADSADPTWVSGKYGSALKFDGSNDYASSTSALLDIRGAQTISLWVKWSNSIAQLMYNKYNQSLFGQLAAIDASNVMFGVRNTSLTWYYAAYPTTNFSSNRWYHLEGTFDGVSSLKLYVNGIQVSTASFSGTVNTPGANATIGACSDLSCYFNGLIDDVRIYNYARTPKQILEDMNANHPAVGSPVGSYVAYWPLNEQASSTAYDKSINKNDLTLNSVSWTTNSKFNGAWNGTGATWLSRADDVDFDFLPTEDFSISMWVKSDSASNPSANEFIIRKANATAGYGIYFDTLGYPTFGIDDDTTWNPDATTSATQDYYDNQWHHIVAIKTGTTTIDMYVDGIKKGTNSSISTINDLTNAVSLVIGDSDATDNGDEFNGDIDEIKIYRFALSPLEIKEEFNRGVSLKLGSLGGSSLTPSSTSSEAQANAYCIPGDTTACAAPVAHWKMDDKAGQYVSDISGNNNTGTLGASSASGTDDPVWKSAAFCKSGSCLSFDGTNDYVNAGSGSSMDVATNAFSLSLWAKFNTLPTNNKQLWLFWKGTTDGSSPGYNLNLANVDGVLKLNLSKHGIANQYLNWTPSTGVWYHITAIQNYSGTPTNVSFYISGSLLGTTSNNTSAYGNTAGYSAYIGWGSTYVGSFPMNGLIDDVRIYNYARTAAQVAWDYNRGAPVAWWKMDDGWNTATTCDGTMSTVKDNSYACKTGGTCNTGILNSSGSPATSTMWSEGKYGCAIDFDGVDDYVNVSNPNNFDFTSGNFTISAWAKFDDYGSYNRIFSKSSSGHWGYTLATEGTTGKVYLYTNSSVISISAIGTGEWKYIASVMDGAGNVSIYVNGVIVVTGTIALPTDNVNDVVEIGRHSQEAQQGMDGSIDDVRIYNYALTATQIKTLFNEGAAVRFGPSSGLP